MHFNAKSPRWQLERLVAALEHAFQIAVGLGGAERELFAVESQHAIETARLVLEGQLHAFGAIHAFQLGQLGSRERGGERPGGEPVGDQGRVSARRT